MVLTTVLLKYAIEKQLLLLSPDLEELDLVGFNEPGLSIPLALIAPDAENVNPAVVVL